MTGQSTVEYTSGERTALMAIAVVGAVGLNGVFLYGVFVRSELIMTVVAAAQPRAAFAQCPEIRTPGILVSKWA